MSTSSAIAALSSRGLRVLVVALAATLAPLAGCGDDAASDGAGGGAGAGDGAGGGAPGCGTVEAPTLLTLRDVSPAPGTVVAGDVAHAFTIVDAPGIIQELTLQAEATHTAGTPTPNQLQFTITQQGADLVYTAAPVTWDTAPSHVELSISGAFQVDEGCVFAFPSPVWSYDVEPGGGEGGAGAGGGGDGGAGGAGDGGAGEGGAG